MLAAGPVPAGHYGIGEATDLYLLGFYPVTSGLCCGTVQHHLGGGGSEGGEITPGFSGNVTCKTTAQSTYEGTDQASVAFLSLLLHPLWSFELIHPRGQVQVCSLTFIYAGSDLYLSIP